MVSMFISIKNKILDLIRRIVGTHHILNELNTIKRNSHQCKNILQDVRGMMKSQAFNTAYSMYKDLSKHDETSDFNKDKFDALLLSALHFSNSSHKYFTRTYQRGLFYSNWIRKAPDGSEYLDIKGVKLTGDIPEIETDGPPVIDLIFQRSLLVHTFFNDNYDKQIVEALDSRLDEGVRGYKDGDFDVTVKQGDVVIDAGAWIGDYSAYAAYKGATVYAFEPTSSTFERLKHTASLNDGNIHPEKMILNDSDGEVPFINMVNSACNNVIVDNKNAGTIESIKSVCLDTFVKERGISKVDFIKADIEGAERNLLQGARQVLRDFAPKLAIATDHLPDDPTILRDIILEANPKYKIVQLRTVMFASVV